MADILGAMKKRRSGVIIGAPRLDENGNPIVIPTPPAPRDPSQDRRGSLAGTFGFKDPAAPVAPTMPANPNPYFSAMQNVALENKTAKKDRAYGYGANLTGGGGLLGMGGSIYRRSLLGIS